MTVSELRDVLDNLITNQDKGDAEVLVADTAGMEDIYWYDTITDLELRNVKNCKGDMVDVLVIL